MHPRTVHIEIGVAESEADRGIGSFRHGSCGLSFGPLVLRSGMPSQRWFASATGYHAREVITHERKAGVQLVSVAISNVGGAKPHYTSICWSDCRWTAFGIAFSLR